MQTPEPDVLVINGRIDPAQLARLVRAHSEDMVKYVVDDERRLVGVGGEMHVDAEQALLEQGSRQSDLWGANDNELLRWRDLIGALYLAPAADRGGHAAAFRVLLQFHPETWRQLPYVTGAAAAP